MKIFNILRSYSINFLLFIKKFLKQIILACVFMFFIILAYYKNFSPISNPFILLFFSIALISIPFFSVKIVKRKTKVWICIATIILAGANWFWVSYYSYYNGIL